MAVVGQEGWHVDLLHQVDGIERGRDLAQCVPLWDIQARGLGQRC
jgi:hypothetical protein